MMLEAKEEEEVEELKAKVVNEEEELDRFRLMTMADSRKVWR
jgi:hypothetical protein